MLYNGDILLQTLNKLPRITWDSFKELYVHICRQESSEDADKAVHATARSDDMRVLDMLGYLDSNFAYGRDDFFLCTPVLYTPLYAERPTAIVAGYVSEQLKHSIARITSEAELGMYSPSRPRFMLPTLIHISADSTDTFPALADVLGIPFSNVPSAVILHHLPSIDDYINQLAWHDFSLHGFTGTYFSPRAARFVSNAPEFEWQLVNYNDRASGLPRYLLVYQGKAAHIEADWGRWVLASRVRHMSLITSENVLEYPRTMPLPKMYARAVALSTMKPPRLTLRRPQPYFSFEGISQPFAAVLARKLGQS